MPNNRQHIGRDTAEKPPRVYYGWKFSLKKDLLYGLLHWCSYVHKILGSRTVSNARNISPFHACNLISYADNLVQGFRVIVHFTGFSIPKMFCENVYISCALHGRVQNDLRLFQTKKYGCRFVAEIATIAKLVCHFALQAEF